MTDTTYLYQVHATLGSVSVAIASATFVYNLQNKLTKRPKGKGKSNQTAVPNTKITDKKKILRTITVTGFLVNDNATIPTAQGKFDALFGSSPLGIMFRPGTLNLVHRSSNYVGSIEKFTIREDGSKRGDKSGGGVDKFEITFTFIVGTVK